MSELLPIGLDLGAGRVRLALSQRSRSGEVALVAIAARDLPENAVTPEAVAEPELVAAAIEDARSELGSRERRCVLCVGVEIAALRLVRFPAMTTGERRRAARFETEHGVNWERVDGPTIVRAHPVRAQRGVYAIGRARASAVAARTACIRLAGLRPVAVDFEACALERAFPRYDGVIDVGLRRSAVYAFGNDGPAGVAIAGGGLALTQAIAADLGIALPDAEKRKRTFGMAGAGRQAIVSLVESLRAVLVATRDGARPAGRVAMTGNGARLTDLADALESACAVGAEYPVSDLLSSTAYPPDVLRANAPDWTLAASLAAWAGT